MLLGLAGDITFNTAQTGTVVVVYQTPGGLLDNLGQNVTVNVNGIGSASLSGTLAGATINNAIKFTDALNHPLLPLIDTSGIPGPERSHTWVNQPEKMHGSKNGAGYKPGQARYGNAVYTYRPDFASGDYREGIASGRPTRISWEKSADAPAA